MQMNIKCYDRENAERMQNIIFKYNGICFVYFSTILINKYFISQIFRQCCLHRCDIMAMKKKKTCTKYKDQ